MSGAEAEDDVVAVLPIHYSNLNASSIHLHQFPLLTRTLQAPPSAISSGKRITARLKPTARRLEIHIPADSRPDVWNSERAKELGTARAEDDREKNQESKAKGEEGEEPRLSEVRLRSEEITQRGSYMLGIVKNKRLHLHPISQTHQLRPTLTYLDILSKRNRRSRGGDDSDSDDGPPPDPDEAPPPLNFNKREKKPAGEAKEVQLTARKSDDKSGAQSQGGLSAIRREMLQAIRTEDAESWSDLQFYDVTTIESEKALDSIFSRNEDILNCTTDMTNFLEDNLKQ